MPHREKEFSHSHVSQNQTAFFMKTSILSCTRRIFARCLLSAGVVAALFCLSLAPCAAGPQLTAAGLTKTLDIGADAPDFALPGVDGKRHSLKDYADAKILMIVFTANHCKTAQAYEERLKQIVSHYQ